MALLPAKPSLQKRRANIGYSISPDVSFDMTFDDIANAIAHELYDKIAASFMNIVNKLQVLNVNRNNIDHVLNELEKKKLKKKKIQKIEIACIKQLTERALTFKPSLPVSWNNRTIKDRNNEGYGDAFDKKVDGLCINTLHDIYNVHSCFLFTNYQQKQYPQLDMYHYQKIILYYHHMTKMKKVIEK
eukprot:388680_1